ncbi:branched-chain amino acid transport system II carrier protein [Lysinibacillus louembei]|uniref:Branched-chain amino acid transport system carrier protein n=1 Tax=Lysinibacillus louembei TaxID=1470088 RepID=A0ABZ0RW20_9BACI|nr:branched-chain amino acid transport system II carrier protein [Lysinibacillus louembei]WPK12433.1 branched-chain amino acid transport system II carrier protein [Lysinibacillus louembei]
MKFFRENLVVGFMLFALFLGAGNIIFPPLLGQQAGEHIIIAMIGFLITGVGLPLIGVITVAKSGGDLHELSSKVNPLFGLIFTSIIYLSIGPFFAIPRTAAVSYEIGIKAPFLSQQMAGNPLALFITTFIFFAITLYLAFNPTKIVDRVGKILTPALLLIILALALKSVITPLGPIGEAQGHYQTSPFFESFIQGYLTMDVLAALVFGIVIVQALNGRGLTDRAAQIKIVIFSGIVAALGLAFVYISLAYIGVTSTSVIGFHKDGGVIIAEATKALFGKAGSVILAATIILACLTTAVGLLSANASFFNKLFPRVSYQVFLIVFTLLGLGIANFGLESIISYSLPVLLAIYPIAIVLMLLALFANRFEHSSLVYGLPLVVTAAISIYDGLKTMGIQINMYESIISKLPLYEQSIGWIIPACIATLLGLMIYSVQKKYRNA